MKVKLKLVSEPYIWIVGRGTWRVTGVICWLALLCGVFILCHLCVCCVYVCVNRTVVVVSQSFPFRNPKAATGGRGLDSVRWLVRITACTQLSGTKPERRQREGRTVLLQHNTRFHLPPKGTVFMWQAETRALGATLYPPITHPPHPARNKHTNPANRPPNSAPRSRWAHLT